MRNTQESGQILRSKERPRPTLRSGRGSRTNSNTSRQIPARVIDAAYDTLPPTDFCAETLAQPPIGPLAADLNRPADYFRPSFRSFSVSGASLTFTFTPSPITMPSPRVT